jgi:hypothetical protein
VSVGRLNDYMGKREVAPSNHIPAVMVDRLETLARYAEVGAI